jgi:hypothetical protein
MAEVGNCGRIKQCHAIWHDKVALFSQRFDAECNKALECEKSNHNEVLTSCGGALFEWIAVLLYNVLYQWRKYLRFEYLFTLSTVTFVYRNFKRMYFRRISCSMHINTHSCRDDASFVWSAALTNISMKAVTFKISMNIMDRCIFTLYFKTHVLLSNDTLLDSYMHIYIYKCTVNDALL